MSQSQTLAIIVIELARGGSGLADKLVQNWKIAVLIAQFARELIKKHWFTRYMNEPQFLMARCLTEPRIASDHWFSYNVPERNMDIRPVPDATTG